MKKPQASLTPFGKKLKIFRIERGEIIYDMAQKLGVSSSYISAIETGKRKIPETFLSKLQQCYKLNSSEYESFKQAAEKSISSITMNFNTASDAQKDLALSFAKKFDRLDKKTIEEINQLMKRR
ncbi:MAG: helix-turn-helix transcriptional regulator [Clostridia bacterium]|nr:helix-turn-helix transcriptional regulator [Clostridia bacterium]